MTMGVDFSWEAVAKMAKPELRFLGAWAQCCKEVSVRRSTTSANFEWSTFLGLEWLLENQLDPRPFSLRDVSALEEKDENEISTPGQL